MTNKLVTFADLRKFREELVVELAKLYQRAPEVIKREYIRSNEACRMLRISENTLRALRRQKALPFRKVGNAVYYHINDLRQLLDAKQDFDRQNR